MDCNETRHLLPEAIDGELDPVRQADVARHLHDCPACARLAAQAEIRNTVLAERLPKFHAPAALADAIRATIRREAPSAATETPAALPPTAHELAGTATAPHATAPSAAGHPPASRPSFADGEGRRPHRGLAEILRPYWQVAGMAAAVSLLVGLGYSWGVRQQRTEEVFRDAITDHVRSLEAGHLMDVVSTDQHTVKPWFAGKIDFSPPVVDLASAGYPLAGGRLEFFDGRRAAALVFHRRQHAINVFIWPAASDLVPGKTAQRDGFVAQAWSHGGLNFVAVSEIPRDELAAFVTAFRAASE